MLSSRRGRGSSAVMRFALRRVVVHCHAGRRFDAGDLALPERVGDVGVGGAEAEESARSIPTPYPSPLLWGGV
jgi:hypothetical protein